MNKKEKSILLDVATVAAIMGDHISEKLYKAVQKKGNGYIFMVELIGTWAIEFERKHRRTNWEKVLDKGMPCKASGGGEIICWDDAVMDYANYKLEQFEK